MEIEKKEITKKKETNTIIISDLHLGSRLGQPEKVLAMLEGYSFQKIILLGDIFDSMDFSTISKESWELLTYIGKISKTRKVRWVIGNHDQGLIEIFKSLVGDKIYESYSWHYQGKKYMAIHGHQFDLFLINNAFLSRLAGKIYNFVQRIDSDKKIFSHYLKKRSKGWLRLSEKVFSSAISYGKENGADFIFCGHTHKTMERKKDGIGYFNSGSWVDNPCSYITIDENNIKIQEYI